MKIFVLIINWSLQGCLQRSDMCTKIFLLKPQTKKYRTKPFICCPKDIDYLSKLFIK